jgi:hypothetical protein
VVGGFEPARRELKKFLYVSDRRRVERRTIAHYTIVPLFFGLGASFWCVEPRQLCSAVADDHNNSHATPISGQQIWEKGNI